MNIQRKPALPMGEFVPLMAFMVSIVALAIDAMLPVLPAIGADFGVKSENDQQLVITALFLGFGIGQMIYGPLSDTIGRKPTIYTGYTIFILGCLLSIFSSSYEMMLAGRVMQGLGAGGPRIVCVALVRDQYEGREMARIMSFVMGIFILVPAIAPAIGQAIVMFVNWRAIFVLFLVLALMTWTWFAIRQPETLPREHRVPFSFTVIWAGIRETCGIRVAFGYTLVAGMIFGALVGYLSSAQQMFAVVYGVVDMFPAYFAVLALGIGVTSVVNAQLVVKLGMRRLSSASLVILTASSSAFFIYAASVGGAPALWLNMIFFTIAFMSFGLLFGNLNALAMEPLGHIAGIGAAVIGSLSTLISVPLGTVVGQMFDGTVLPLVGSFALFGAIAIALSHWTERGRELELASETSEN